MFSTKVISTVVRTARSLSGECSVVKVNIGDSSKRSEGCKGVIMDFSVATILTVMYCATGDEFTVDQFKTFILGYDADNS